MFPCLYREISSVVVYNPKDIKLGHCKLIGEVMIGEDKLIHFSGQCIAIFG
jgi:hypothetical protein